MDLFHSKSKSTTNDKKHALAVNAASNENNNNKLHRKSSAQKSPPLSPRERSANANASVKEFYFGSGALTKTNFNTSIHASEKSPRPISSSKSSQPAAMSLQKPQTSQSIHASNQAIQKPQTSQSIHASSQALQKVQIKPQSSHHNIANMPSQSQQAPRYQITHFSNTSTIQPISKKTETAPVSQQPSRISSAQFYQNPQHVKTPQNVHQGPMELQRTNSKTAHKLPEPKGPQQLQNSPSILNLIIKSDSANGKSNINFEEPIFDPEPAPEETDTFSHTIVS